MLAASRVSLGDGDGDLGGDEDRDDAIGGDEGGGVCEDHGIREMPGCAIGGDEKGIGDWDVRDFPSVRVVGPTRRISLEILNILRLQSTRAMGAVAGMVVAAKATAPLGTMRATRAARVPLGRK